MKRRNKDRTGIERGEIEKTGIERRGIDKVIESSDRKRKERE